LIVKRRASLNLAYPASKALFLGIFPEELMCFGDQPQDNADHENPLREPFHRLESKHRQPRGGSADQDQRSYFSSRFRPELPIGRKDSVRTACEVDQGSSELLMGNRSRKNLQPGGGEKLKGYGLVVYGAMMIGGGMLAKGHPAFIVVAVFGVVAFILGVRSLVRHAQQERVARNHLRNHTS
jgi:hypothetical protein